MANQTSRLEQLGINSIVKIARSGEECKNTEALGLLLLESMGFGKDDLILEKEKTGPTWVPKKRDKFPWALFCVPSPNKDLAEFFDRYVRQWLLSDAGEGTRFVILTDFVNFSVFNERRIIDDYSCNLLEISRTMASWKEGDPLPGAVEQWERILRDFGRTQLGTSGGAKASALAGIPGLFENHSAKQSSAKELAEEFFGTTLKWASQTEDSALLKALALKYREKYPTIGLDDIRILIPSSETASVGILIPINQDLEHVPTLRKLHQASIEIARERSKVGRETSIVFLWNGRILVMLDHTRPRDHRFVFSKDRLHQSVRARDALEDLHVSRLQKVSRFGKQRVDFSKFFEELPFDKTFFSFVDDYRRSVIQALLEKPNTVKDVLNKFDAGFVKAYEKDISWVNQTIRNHRSKETLLAVVDTYLLRQLLHQFIEAYHGVSIKPSHQMLLETFAEKSIFSKSSTKSKDTRFRFDDPYILKKGKESDFKQAFLKLNNAYAEAYKGDVHTSQLAQAVEILERDIEPNILSDVLDLFSQKRYSFRYSDIRPETLENYYQTSLGTDVDIQLKKSGQFSIEIVDSIYERKRGGSYFTPHELASFVAEKAIEPLLIDHEERFRAALSAKKWQESALIVAKVLDWKICDPTVGGNSFGRAAYRYVTKEVQERILNPLMEDGTASLKFLAEKFPWLSDSNSDLSADFEHHALTHMFYGVDIDLKALCIASQTLTLESLRYLRDSECFPSFININFKRGNAFVRYFANDSWKKVPAESVKKLMNIRDKARNATDLKALLLLFAEEQDAKFSILRKTHKDMIENYGDAWETLSPFEWSLEFPEVFFDANGTPKQNPGFDVIVGNPPWEGISPCDDDFFPHVDPDWPVGKSVGKEEKARHRDSLLKKSPQIREAHERYIAEHEVFNSFINSGEFYTLQKPQFKKIKGTSGDNNTWKLAAESYPNLLLSSGRFGILVPEGFAGDKGARDLRLSMIDKRQLEIILGFNKQNEFFSGTQAFCAIIGSYSSKHDYYRYKTGLQSLNDLRAMTPMAIEDIPGVESASVLANNDELKALIGISNPIEHAILQKMKIFPTPNSDMGPWPVHPYRELDTTFDNDLESTSDTGYAIAKGQDCQRFTFTKPDRFLKYREFQKRVGNRYSIDDERVAWRNIAGTNDVRRMYATIIPPKIAAYNSFNVIRPEQTKQQKRVLVAILNSFVFEWLIRKQSKNNNLNIFLVAESPIPRPADSDPMSLEIYERVEHIYSGKVKNKEDIEAEIEAQVAILYGLNRSEFEFVVETFSKVSEDYRKLVLRKFDEIIMVKKAA